jgi:hypothetical protein
MKGKTRRFLWILGLACLIVFAVFWAVRAGKFASYPFVTQLGGQERRSPGTYISRSRSFVVISGGEPQEQYYVFRAPLGEVQSAMKRELLSQHWTLDYADDEFATYSRDGERATLQGGAPTDEYTCTVTVPRHSTWLEECVDSVRDRLGTKEVLPMLGGDPSWVAPFEWKPSRIGGRCAVTVTWRNRCPDDVTANIGYFYVQGYEPDQELPRKLRIPAWHKTTAVLTFPPDAFPGNRLDSARLDVKERHSLTTISGSVVSEAGEGGPNDYPGLKIDVWRNPPGLSHRQAVLSNGAPRPLELRNVSVFLRSKKMAVLAHSVLPVLGDVRILFDVPGKSPTILPGIKVWGEARLLPNKRWVAFKKEF